MPTRPEHISALDLTQHTGVLVTGDPVADPSPAVVACPCFSPAVLLPFHDREPVIAGPHACGHRRGAGLSWPPEAQIPPSREDDRGCGRVPLALAWARLVLSADRDDPDFPPELSDYDQSPFVWRPQNGQMREIRPEMVITESAKAWAANGGKKTALVVPDSLGEKAQQALLDGYNCPLVPRTMALAVAWCRRNEERFQHVETDSTDGTSLGFLWTVSMAMDVWEMDLVEVRAVKPAAQNRVWLVPVRHRRQRTDLPFVGLGLASDILLRGELSVPESWRILFASAQLEEWLAQAGPAQLGGITQALRAHSSSLNRKLGSLNAVSKGVCELASNGNTDLFAAVHERVGQLRQAAADSPIIGAVAGGSFAPVIRLDDNELWQPLVRTVPRTPHSIHIGERQTAATGAWHVAHAMNSTPPLPSYRDTLVPVEIYVIRPQRGSDWIPVVPSIAIDAGQPYRSPEPIRGFSIAAGADHLDFTVRRPIRRDVYIYRGLPAELAQRIPQQESVSVTAEAFPGQGYARVSVTSTREGLFATRLNWHRMVVVPAPEEIRPHLAYIPNVSRVEPSRHIWARVENPNAPEPWLTHNHSGGLWPQCAGLMRRYVAAQNRPSVGIVWQLIGLHYGRNVGNMNRWPFAHLEAQERGEEMEPDLFLHTGVFGSDGDLANLPTLAAQFQTQLGSHYADDHDPVLCRLGGWMYAAAPDDIKHAAHQCFERFNDGPADEIPRSSMKLVFLHVAGLAFSRVDEYALFLRAMTRAIESGRVEDISLGEDDNPAGAPMHVEWLRALRNMVRFRDDALCHAAVTDDDMRVITRYVVNVFADKVVRRVVQHQPGGMITRLLNECLRALPFMLKRRRDDPDYLGPEYDAQANAPRRPRNGFRRAGAIRQLLEEALQRVTEADPALLNRQHPEQAWQIPFAISTLRFLREEAQLEDVRNILQYSD